MEAATVGYFGERDEMLSRCLCLCGVDNATKVFYAIDEPRELVPMQSISVSSLSGFGSRFCPVRVPSLHGTPLPAHLPPVLTFHCVRS